MFQCVDAPTSLPRGRPRSALPSGSRRVATGRARGRRRRAGGTPPPRTRATAAMMEDWFDCACVLWAFARITKTYDVVRAFDCMNKAGICELGMARKRCSRDLDGGLDRPLPAAKPLT